MASAAFQQSRVVRPAIAAERRRATTPAVGFEGTGDTRLLGVAPRSTANLRGAGASVLIALAYAAVVLGARWALVSLL